MSKKVTLKVSINAGIKHTAKVTHALSAALGWDESCGWVNTGGLDPVVNYQVGNIHGKTRKNLHAKLIDFINETGTSFANLEALKTAVDGYGCSIFSVA